MGKYYAQNESQNTIICDSIEEHYLPRNAYDTLPKSLESTLVGLADRIDTIVGFFAVGKKVTSSSDPFSLRRSSIACIHLAIVHQLFIKFTRFIESVY